MDRRFLQPRWLLAHLVVLAVAVLFVFLGFWQLNRNTQRVAENRVGQSRLQSAPIDLNLLIAEGVDDPIELEYRPTQVRGVFDPSHEVLIRSQVFRGNAGFHVITPLVIDDDHAVMVNRGWVSLDLDSVPVAAPPPAGQVEVMGWVHLSQDRPPLGPEDPAEGTLTILNRVDIDRIAAQIPYTLARLYVVEISDLGDSLPISLPLPTFDDHGPHLAYSIQWFSFALIGLIGYVFLMRRRLRSG